MKRPGTVWTLALMAPVVVLCARLLQPVPNAPEALGTFEVLSTRVASPLRLAAALALPAAAPQWTLDVQFRGGTESIILRSLDRPVVDGVDFLEGRGRQSEVVVRAVTRRDRAEMRSVEFWPDGSIVDRHRRDGRQVSSHRTVLTDAIRGCKLVAEDERRFGDPALPRRVILLDGQQVRASTSTGLAVYTIAPIFTGRLASEIMGGVTAGILPGDLTLWFDNVINAANFVFEHELGITLRRVDIDNAYPANTQQNAFGGGPESLAASGHTVASAAPQSFDLAHLFAYGSGPSGWASIGSACGTGRGKAVTVTGGSESGTLVTFLHEVGHQLGAHHSFNTASEARSVFNSGFEPGWGVTLMGYATEFNTFHAGSAMQIDNYLGGACGVHAGGSPPTPTLRTASSRRDVPAGTAFTLEVDSDPSLACVRWDGIDPGHVADDRPPFFASEATCSLARSFPSAPHTIVRSNLPRLMPISPVSLTFRATGWSAALGRATTNVLVTIDSAGPFEVSDLTCVAACEARSRAVVTWDSALITMLPFKAVTMRAELVYKTGETFALHPGVTVTDQQLDFVIPPPSTLATAPCVARPHQARVVLRPEPGGYFAVSEWIGVTVPNECVSP